MWLFLHCWQFGDWPDTLKKRCEDLRIIRDNGSLTTHMVGGRIVCEGSLWTFETNYCRTTLPVRITISRRAYVALQAEIE